MPVMTSSLTALAFAPGELKTHDAALGQFVQRDVVTPAPARATHCTLAGMSISCMFAERSMMASGFSA